MHTGGDSELTGMRAFGDRKLGARMAICRYTSRPFHLWAVRNRGEMRARAHPGSARSAGGPRQIIRERRCAAIEKFREIGVKMSGPRFKFLS